MSKLLRPRDRLILGIALLADAFDELRDPGGIMATSYKQVYGFVPSQFKKRNFANLVSRNLKTGNIEKIVRGNQVFFRLTSVGSEMAYRNYPLLALRKRKWDRLWRIVVFDIPQKKALLRDTLRKKLKNLGFGMLQESIWVSPHDFVTDLREFLEVRGLSEMVFVLEAKNIAGIPDKKIGVQAFHLDEVNKAYENLLQEYSKLLRLGKNAVSILRSTYLEIFLRDPLLPKEFLPDGWLGEKARRAILSEIK